MTESSLNLADKQDLTFLAELVADLRAVAPLVRTLLVGAVARDLLLFYAHGIRAPRATADIDLAMAVADWNAFERLRDALLASGMFVSDLKVAHKCIGSGWKWTSFPLAELSVLTQPLPGPRKETQS